MKDRIKYQLRRDAASTIDVPRFTLTFSNLRQSDAERILSSAGKRCNEVMEMSGCSIVTTGDVAEPAVRTRIRNRTRDEWS